MKSPVRVRYAPSPTGYPHVGNIRTALFNWLFARHTGGIFIVRIEDTDRSRIVEGATEAILQGLRWLGLDWDEGPEIDGKFGPYFQSKRLDYYRHAVRRMLEEERAYLCFCSPRRLEQLRQQQMKEKKPPGYDRLCRNLTSRDREKLIKEGAVPVVRFKTPLEGRTPFNDIIRGEVIFDNSGIDDFVLLKSDGYPTYHLASVVDDHLMQISHVMRADEWVSSTPRHILLYQALGYRPPLFAHLPMILGPDRSKLSKRHGATSIVEYQEMGFLSEAMFNFLALLGWSLDDKTEIMSRSDLINNFSIERISKAAAIFNIEKLNWMNGVYTRKLLPDDFTDKALPFLKKGLPDINPSMLDRNYIKRVMSLIQERTKMFSEIPQLTEFFFRDIATYDINLLIIKGLSRDKCIEVLKLAVENIQSVLDWTHETLEVILRPLAEVLGLKTGEFFGVLRVAITGRTAAPPLFQTMEVIGQERTVKRLKHALGKLTANNPA